MKLSLFYLLFFICYVNCKAIDDIKSEIEVAKEVEATLQQQMEQVPEVVGGENEEIVRERRHPAAYAGDYPAAFPADDGVEPGARLLGLGQPIQKTLSFSMGPPHPPPLAHHPVPVQPVISGYSLTPVYGPPPPPPVVVPHHHTYAVPVPVAPPPPPPVHHHTYIQQVPVPVAPPPPPPVHHTYIHQVPVPVPPPQPPVHHDHLVYLAQPPLPPPALPPCPHAAPYPPVPQIYYKSRGAKGNDEFNTELNSPNYVPMPMVYQNLMARAANGPGGWNPADSNIDDYSAHNLLLPPRKREADIDVQNIN